MSLPRELQRIRSSASLRRLKVTDRVVPAQSIKESHRQHKKLRATVAVTMAASRWRRRTIAARPPAGVVTSRTNLVGWLVGFFTL